MNALAEKCVTCIYGEYRPRGQGRVAFHPERIRCTEGWFGMPSAGRMFADGHSGYPFRGTFWYSVAALGRPDSKVKETIKYCDWRIARA